MTGMAGMTRMTSMARMTEMTGVTRTTMMTKARFRCQMKSLASEAIRNA